MKINRQTNKQTNKNKANLKFYESMNVFLSKKCEITSSRHSRLDIQETSYRRP